MNNDYSIDLAKYYGLPVGGTDSVDTSVNYHPNIPSLEQIASYNLQQARAEAARDGGTSSQTAPQPSSAAHSHQTPASYDMGAAGGETMLPSGMRAAAAQDGSLQPIPEYNQPFPITADNIQYLNGFIRSQVGRNVSIEFLVGTNQLVTKEGFLVAVGANFILLNPKGTNDILACDFYNIKFITFYY